MCITNTPWKGILKKKATKCEDLAVIYILIASAAAFFPPLKNTSKIEFHWAKEKQSRDHSSHRLSSERPSEFFQSYKSLSIHILKALETSMSSELKCICDKYIWNCALTKM